MDKDIFFFLPIFGVLVAWLMFDYLRERHKGKGYAYGVSGAVGYYVVYLVSGHLCDRYLGGVWGLALWKTLLPLVPLVLIFFILDWQWRGSGASTGVLDDDIDEL